MKRCLAGLAGAVVVFSSFAVARGPSARVEPARPVSLPSPIAVGRLRVEVRAGKVLVTTDLTIPEAAGELHDFDVHVAYGAPGVPAALDARVMSTPPGFQVAPIESDGIALRREWSARASNFVPLVIGRPQMGGQVVHVLASALAAAQRATGRATLRIREVRTLPPLLSDGSRELVVRLPSADGKAAALGLIEFASDAPMARVEARFCGPNGEGPSLFVSGISGEQGRAAPPLVERASHDDLCLRFGELTR